MVALKARDHSGPPVAFQLLIYPVLDFGAMDTESHRLFADGFIIGGAAHEFTRDSYLPNSADHRHPYASPLRSDVFTGLPPALVITAQFDPLRDEGEMYARKLSDAGGHARVTRYQGVTHAFLYTPPALSSKVDEALDEAAAAIREALE